MPRGIPKNAAESGQVNRAEMIRTTAKTMGKSARPRDIVAALKQQGVAVSHSLVSKTLKKAGLRRAAAGKKAARAKSGENISAAARGSGETSKAQRIRDAAKSLGKKVRPRDVVAELAKDGVTVSFAQVSTTLAAAGYRRRRRGKRAAVAKPASSTGLNLDSLLAAKALIEKVGGVEAAEEAVKALKRLG